MLLLYSFSIIFGSVYYDTTGLAPPGLNTPFLLKHFRLTLSAQLWRNCVLNSETQRYVVIYESNKFQIQIQIILFKRRSYMLYFLNVK